MEEKYVLIKRQRAMRRLCLFLLSGGLIPKISPRTTAVVAHAYVVVGEFLGAN